MAEQDCRGCNVSNAVLFDPSASTSIVPLGREIDVVYGIGKSELRASSDGRECCVQWL